ncbi:PEP-CTERM sorting domain-containing protein [Pseudoduganella sp. FT25W]|uniref:PEP-CTERM sorting domain-containing protein n=1 Tax=Duganella alba TaxID=2666081 RepID=A0A6L5QM04_9BURK|nr:PEP-CTERM sorting domain-containing protein [Duganella alba]MRX17824.1 PEP-CTERM sorting domain-containing protein [Duganella alba]
MKVLSLISTALLALSLAGAVQAQPAAPETSNSAPATIVLAHCESSDTAPCSTDVAVDRNGDIDPHTLPPADPKQRPQNDPATPVPEPHTFVMLMLGLLVLGVVSRRRQSTDKFDD